MNNHLNLFKTYTKEDREKQLENDLTRGLALTLLEDNLFLHSFLKYIFKHKENAFDNIFGDFSGKEPIKIDIQKRVSTIPEVDHLFAVSLSEYKMNSEIFFDQNYDREYDPRTDLLITIDNVAVIVEVKPWDYDCTAQLYNQALNAWQKPITNKEVTPVDFNWKKLMLMALQVNNFQKATSQPSRFLNDFIQYIQAHNFRWLPQKPLAALSIRGNPSPIYDRIDTAIKNSKFTSLEYKRLGFVCDKPWADEIILELDPEGENLEILIYPGNTKRQGGHIFNQSGEPEFKEFIEIDGNSFPVYKKYHIKLTGQNYITGLWAGKNDFSTPLYTQATFRNHSGRKERKTGAWEQIENLFDLHFVADYNWKKKLHWKKKIIESNRKRFDISFGYELKMKIPYKFLQELDTDKDDLSGLDNFLNQINSQFSSLLLNNEVEHEL